MGMLLLLAGAAALTAPEPRPAARVTPGDYPAEARYRGEQGAVLVSVLVSPRGKALACRIEETTGGPFGEAVCNRLKRGGFAPATDREGKRPMASITRSTPSR